MTSRKAVVERFLAERGRKEGKTRFMERNIAFYGGLSAGVLIAVLIINPESTITLPVPVTLSIIFVFSLSGGYLAARREWRRLEKIGRDGGGSDSADASP